MLHEQYTGFRPIVLSFNIHWSYNFIVLQVSKEFMMSPNKLHLECSLDKELYYHGETISVNVHIQVSHFFSDISPIV